MTTTRTSIPKPDVKVTIQSQTSTPTTTAPALPACVVGACYQVVDPQLSTGLAANPDAQVSLPAIIRSFGPATDPGGGGGWIWTITVVVNGVTATVTNSSYTSVAAVVSAFNSALAAAGAAGTASVVGVSGTTMRFYLKTNARGSGNYISWSITGGDASLISGALQIPVSWRAEGYSTYNNDRVAFYTDDYPDPMGNIDEVDVSESTVRMFEGLSTGLSEISKTSTTERCGECSISYPDDGDSDGFTPLVLFTAAGAKPYDIGSGVPFVPSVDVNLADFTTAAVSQASYTAPAACSGTGPAGTLWISVNGCQEQAISIGAGDAGAAVAAKVNAYYPGVCAYGATLAFTTALLTVTYSDLEAFGRASSLSIRASSAALRQHLFNNGGADTGDIVTRGRWHPLSLPAELWINGEFKGNVVEITTNQLKLDREVPVVPVASTKSFILKRTSLPARISSTAMVGEQEPDLFVDTAGTSNVAGTVRVKADLLRDTRGMPLRPPYTAGGAACSLYMGYTALRLDVSPSASDPSLLAYSSAVDLATDLAPIDTRNPLGLGMYFALLNAPGLTIYGLGVDEVSTTYPEGTLAAYTECAEFLESKEVYSLVPLSHNESVAQLLHSHVSVMSDPDMKMERILWWCPELPVRKRSTIIASGALGNTTGAIGGASGTFYTNIPDLAARFVAAGVDPTATFTPSTAGIYLEVAAFSPKIFAITNVVGSAITIADEPTAPFEADISLSFTTQLIDEPFTIGKLGASLYSGTTYDKESAAEAIHDLGQEFADRRVRMVVPDKVVATVGGLSSTIEGYYACCALAGMKAANSPSQGFTNLAIAGLDSVQRTQGYFKGSQLNLMAGGGAWILVPGPGGGNVVTRMSLTTDTSTVEYRQDSWTSSLDYGAKYIRATLRRVIGPTNITQASIDLVATLVNSCLQYLMGNQIWVDASLSSIHQSDVSPDTLDVGISTSIPYNLMYIDVTVTV